MRRAAKAPSPLSVRGIFVWPSSWIGSNGCLPVYKFDGGWRGAKPDVRSEMREQKFVDKSRKLDGDLLRSSLE